MNLANQDTVDNYTTQKVISRWYKQKPFIKGGFRYLKYRGVILKSETANLMYPAIWFLSLGKNPIRLYSFHNSLL